MAATQNPIFESGKIILTTGDEEALEVNLIGKLINVDIKDKEFIKRAIKLRGDISKMMSKPQETTGEKPKKKKSSGPLAMLRTVAETLCKRGITVTVSFKGNKLLTLGADANPKLLQIVTRTKGVAVNSFFKLIGLIL